MSDFGSSLLGIAIKITIKRRVCRRVHRLKVRPGAHAVGSPALNAKFVQVGAQGSHQAPQQQWRGQKTQVRRTHQRDRCCSLADGRTLSCRSVAMAVLPFRWRWGNFPQRPQREERGSSRRSRETPSTAASRSSRIRAAAGAAPAGALLRHYSATTRPLDRSPASWSPSMGILPRSSRDVLVKMTLSGTTLAPSKAVVSRWFGSLVNRATSPPAPVEITT